MAIESVDKDDSSMTTLQMDTPKPSEANEKEKKDAKKSKKKKKNDK